MRRGPQAHDLRTEIDEPVVLVMRFVVERDVNGHSDLRFAIYDCRFELLLLLFLLHHDFFLKIVEVLENVGVEQRAADVIELALQAVKVTVQPGGENFINGA